jgi:hypothetical protein
MEEVRPNQADSVDDPRTRLRIVSVELNNATAAFHRARYAVLYHRLRAIPARHDVPSWVVALILAAIGALAGSIPVLLLQGTNLLSLALVIAASYTLLAPATLFLLVDRYDETDSTRREVREVNLAHAIRHRNELAQRVRQLEEKQKNLLATDGAPMNTDKE